MQFEDKYDDSPLFERIQVEYSTTDVLNGIFKCYMDKFVICWTATYDGEMPQFAPYGNMGF